VDRILNLARRDIPLTKAYPWLLGTAMIPLWFAYLKAFGANVTIAVIGSLGPDSVARHKELGNDLMLFWPVAHLIRAGHASEIYNPALFSKFQNAYFGNSVPGYFQCPYLPPGLLPPLLLAPFGILSGYLVWTVTLTGISIVLLRRTGMPWPVILLGLASVASIFNLLAGQLGLLTGAVFILGLDSIDRLPRRAAVCFGSLIIKPQAGLLAPIILLARGSYRLIVGSAIIVGFLCILATIICGYHIWPAYFLEGTASAHKILVAPFPNQYEDNGASVFWMMRSLGATVSVALATQVSSGVGASVWCWIAWRRESADRRALMALTCALTLLVTPYCYTVDLCGLVLMVAWLAWERRKLQTADVLIWMWPALCPIIATSLHMELTPLILLLGAIRAYHRLDGIGTTAPACYPASV
jgi:hypothetical protein